MTILAWIVLGAIAGAIANWAVKGGFGMIGTVVLGIVGAVVGGAIGNFLFASGSFTEINWVSLVLSVFGAILVIGFAKVMFKGGSD